MKFFVTLITICTIYSQEKVNSIYKNDLIEIKQITHNAFIHISYIKTETWGKVASNGVIIIADDEAIVIDTPVDDESSIELIRWLEEIKKKKIVAVIGTHFHRDAIGGLKAFHQKDIPSYGKDLSAELSNKNKVVSPKYTFSIELELKVAKKFVIAEYFGEGHTKDNIIVYFPEQKIMHGGCLIKSLNAGKGNLDDANVLEWSRTVSKIKRKYPDIKIVVPGHGKAGQIELLDRTIDMFKKD